MQPWYLYIIENRLGQLYTGVTPDPARRFAEHQLGGRRCAKALRGKGPIQLRFCAQLADRSSALQAEYRVKQLSRTTKLALVQGQQVIDEQWSVMSDKQLRVLQTDNAGNSPSN